MLWEILLPLKCDIYQTTQWHIPEDINLNILQDNDKVNGIQELPSVTLVRTKVVYDWALRGKLQVSQKRTAFTVTKQWDTILLHHLSTYNT